MENFEGGEMNLWELIVFLRLEILAAVFFWVVVLCAMTRKETSYTGKVRLPMWGYMAAGAAGFYTFLVVLFTLIWAIALVSKWFHIFGVH